MSQLILWTCAVALCIGIFWLGVDSTSLLMRVLVRPAILALMALLLMVVAAGEQVVWPHALIAVAAMLGLWESYAGAYALIGSTHGLGRDAALQVKICAGWLGNALANLTLLNLAAHQAYAGTFRWQGESASVLDVAYLTILTFASGGYGDVLPATVMGKSLVMLTSMAGLIFATILFAALFESLRAE